MFKKWFASVLCVLVLMMSIAPVSVFAGPDDVMTFTLTVTEGGVGDTVTVSISIPENSRFTNAMLYLHYNPEAVSYVADSLEAGSASPKSGTMFEALDHKDKYFVKCAYITGGVVTKGGVLLKFDFEVLSAVPAAFSLSFDECQGEAEDGTMFEVKHQVIGCVLNNDGTVSNPTGEPVYGTTSSVDTTTATMDASATTTTMATMVVTDEGNNQITIPVVTSVDANGNVVTVPVVAVTDAQGATVTVPVVIVTDTQGSVATIPVADGTDANGNDATIPVAIVTDEYGSIQTVPVVTSVDANGNIVTVPVTTSETEPTQAIDYYESATDNGGLTTGVIVIVIGAIVAVVLAIAAMKLRKKKEESEEETEE